MWAAVGLSPCIFRVHHGKVLCSVQCCKAGRAPALLSLRFSEEDISKCVYSFSADAELKIELRMVLRD